MSKDNSISTTTDEINKKFCPKCGQEVSENAPFCGSYGTKQ